MTTQVLTCVFQCLWPKLLVVVPLQVTPVNCQVRHRGIFFPPHFSLLIPEIAAGLAETLSEVFGLKSANMVFNQTSIATQYISFRYILPKEPLRYLDTLIGVDQTEIVFSNPASLLELREEYLKVWEGIIEELKPNVAEHYFEATLHSTVDGISVREFLNTLVSLPLEGREDINKGFSLTVKEPRITGEARLGLEISTSIPDGLYVVFGCGSKRTIENSRALGELFDTVAKTYRHMQTLAQIEILEPK